MFCWGIIIAGVYECYFVNVKDVDFVNVKDVELGYILGSCVIKLAALPKLLIWQVWESIVIALLTIQQ